MILTGTLINWVNALAGGTGITRGIMGSAFTYTGKEYLKYTSKKLIMETTTVND